MHRSTVRFAHLALLCAALAAMGCGGEEGARPNLVLVTVDTLRADRLGAYGATTATPNLDALAQGGVVFESVTAPLPETRPSHASLFTSRYPQDHGVVSNALTLADEALTLTEVLAEAGYRTAGFAGCSLLYAGSGAEQGFGVLGQGAPDEHQRPAATVVDEAVAWLGSLDGEAPFFLWVHLFDPHMPYAPPQTEAALDWRQIFAAAERHDGDLPARVLRRGLALYDAEVEAVDRELGRLFAAVERAAPPDETVVTVTADHGECFGGGVWFDHSPCLGEGALHVPLLLRGPGRLPAGERRDDLASLLDVAPTLLDLAGVPAPDAFAGRSLLAADAGAEEPLVFFQHPLYRESDLESRRQVHRRLRSVAGEPTRPILGEAPQVGARGPRWKYVRRGAHESLYDLVADPEETRDLAAAEPEVLRRHRGAVRRWLAAHPFPEAVDDEIDPELRRQLEALGYL